MPWPTAAGALRRPSPPPMPSSFEVAAAQQLAGPDRAMIVVHLVPGSSTGSQIAELKFTLLEPIILRVGVAVRAI